MLDFREAGNERTDKHWLPIIQATGDKALFFEFNDDVNSYTAQDFLTFQAGNPNSLVSVVALARENARMVRDQVTVEIWEEINRIYLFLKSTSARDLWDSNPSNSTRRLNSVHFICRG